MHPRLRTALLVLVIIIAGYGKSRPPPPLQQPPPHDYTPATRASPDEALMIQEMLELPTELGLFRTLRVDGKKVIVTVGRTFRILRTRDIQTWVNTALDWGRLTTTRVRDVDFVTEDGRLLASYEPVGGVRMITAATTPTSEPSAH